MVNLIKLFSKPTRKRILLSSQLRLAIIQINRVANIGIAKSNNYQISSYIIIKKLGMDWVIYAANQINITHFELVVIIFTQTNINIANYYFAVIKAFFDNILYKKVPKLI